MKTKTKKPPPKAAPTINQQPAAIDEDHETSLVHHLPHSEIAPFRHQPRRVFDEKEMEDLVASVREHGVQQAILVRPNPDAGRPDGYGAGAPYELIAGERRLRAARLAGMRLVPALIRHLGDKEALEVAIIENDQRVNVGAIDRALGYKKLADMGQTQDQIAGAVGKSRPAVANALRLLELPDEVQAMISAGTLSEAHGRALAPHKDYPEFLKVYAAKIVKEGLSSKEIEKGIVYETWRDAEKLGEYLIGVAEDDGKAWAKQYPGKFFKRAGGGFACFDKELVKRLNEKRREDAERREATRLEAARQALAATRQAATEGPVTGQEAGNAAKLPHLNSLDCRVYERIPAERCPAGCTAACPCRGSAIGYQNEVVSICTDPKHFQQLKGADTRARNKEQRQKNEVQLARLAAYLDEVGAKPRDAAHGAIKELVTVRSLAIAVLPLASEFSAATWDKVESAWARLVPGATATFDARKFRDFGAKPAQRLDMLASLGGTALLCMIVEGAVREDLERVVSGDACNHKGYAEWFLDGLPSDVTTPLPVGAVSDADPRTVRTLASGSVEDINFKTALDNATAPDIEAALKEIEGRTEQTTRRKKLDARLSRLRKNIPAPDGGPKAAPSPAGVAAGSAPVPHYGVRVEWDGTGETINVRETNLRKLGASKAAPAATVPTGKQECARCGEERTVFGVSGYWEEPLANGVLRSSCGESYTPNGEFYCATCSVALRICRKCGCTERTGVPCTWVEGEEPPLCSACQGVPACDLIIPDEELESDKQRLLAVLTTEGVLCGSASGQAGLPILRVIDAFRALAADGKAQQQDVQEGKLWSLIPSDDVTVLERPAQPRTGVPMDRIKAITVADQKAAEALGGVYTNCARCLEMIVATPNGCHPATPCACRRPPEHDFAVGDTVQHEMRRGDVSIGVVSEIHGNRISFKFPNGAGCTVYADRLKKANASGVATYERGAWIEFWDTNEERVTGQVSHRLQNNAYSVAMKTPRGTLIQGSVRATTIIGPVRNPNADGSDWLVPIEAAEDETEIAEMEAAS